MTDPLIVFGTGGHAKVVFDVAASARRQIDFAVDDSFQGTDLFGVRVIRSNDPLWNKIKSFRFIVAVGDNQVRARIFSAGKERGGIPESLIHPFSAVSPRASLGAGVLVCAGAVINPSARIGDNVIINTGASVDHDCTIEDHAHICPGVHLAGTVTIGARTMVGTGTSVIPGITIGADSVIGAGALVNRYLPARVLAFGSPAQVIRSLDSQGNPSRVIPPHRT